MNAIHRPAARLLAALTLTACGGAESSGMPLGRSIAPVPQDAAAANPAAAPAGDPPAERGGTIPPGARTTQEAISPTGVAPTPERALRRYALAYTNWQAARLGAREHLLAGLSIGPAKLRAEQTAAGAGATTALVAKQVANTGRVLAIARAARGPPGRWVVVTEERTTGTGPYAGLPAGPHVTFAQVTYLPGRGYAVSAWNPAS